MGPATSHARHAFFGSPSWGAYTRLGLFFPPSKIHTLYGTYMDIQFVAEMGGLICFERGLHFISFPLRSTYLPRLIFHFDNSILAKFLFFSAQKGGLLLVLANRHLISTILLYLPLVG
jgi:hypothetical protein